MGKHKNRTQNKIFLEFMEKYPDIARGFTKRDKPSVNVLWQQLTESLNAAGPPLYDVNGWKKKWIEWKSEVKRKHAKNIAQSKANGDGIYTKYQLTATDATIMHLCGFAESTDGMSVTALDVSEDTDDSIKEEMPSTSSKRSLSADLITNAPKRFRTESTDYYVEEVKVNLELSEKLDQLIKIEQENSKSLKKTYRAIKKGNKSVVSAVNDLKNEFLRFNAENLKCKEEKIELKRRQLYLEREKFEYEKLHRRDL